MDLLLVRCADLESGARTTADETAAGQELAAREPMNAGLSERGQRHARRLASWLRQHAPRELQIFSSPSKAGREMAGLFANGLGERALTPVISRLLGPEADAADLLGAVGWPDDHRAALIIAHQPALGSLAGLLLSGQETPLAFKKGAMWWFSKRQRGEQTQTVLRCVLTPDLMKSGGRHDAADAVDPPNALAGMMPSVADLMRARFGVIA